MWQGMMAQRGCPDKIQSFRSTFLFSVSARSKWALTVDGQRRFNEGRESTRGGQSSLSICASGTRRIKRDRFLLISLHKRSEPLRPSHGAGGVGSLELDFMYVPPVLKQGIM